MSNRKKILITGAAGKIGRVLKEGLKDDYDLRLMYHRTVLPAEEGEEVVICDIADFDCVKKAVDGVDTVVHQAADPAVDATWESVLHSNIIGVYNVYEACRQCGVNKVVFASTNHVTGYYEKDGRTYTTPDMPVRPDSYYGASKAFGEALGRYYSDAFGMSVICHRIGSFIGGEPEEGKGRILSTWMSNRDYVQLTRLSIETDVKFGIFYAISGNTRRYWDISSAQEILGYKPQDDAERFAEEGA